MQLPPLIIRGLKALIELNDLFEQAKSVATDEALQDVKNSELCRRYYKMYKKLFEFSKGSEYENQMEHYYFDIAQTKATRMHEVEQNYALSNIAQSAIIDLRPLSDLVVGNFIYGP